MLQVPEHPSIIVVGPIGSGKSSLANMILAGNEIALTSAGPIRCTRSNQPYNVKLDDSRTVTLWDTAGLDQGSPGDFNDISRQAVHKLIISLNKDLILLIFCFQGRLHKDIIENYQMCRKICNSTVRIAVVVSGMEREPDRVGWWKTNEVGFRKAGIKFDDHACIAGIKGNRIGDSNSFVYGEAYDTSAIEVNAMINRAYPTVAVSRNLFQATQADSWVHHSMGSDDIGKLCCGLWS